MTVIVLKNVRLAFSNIYEATAFEEGQEKKFGATLLIPKSSPQIAEINKAIDEVAAAKWGAKAKATLDSIRGNPNKFCFRDGAEKVDYEGFEGVFSISAKNAARPVVVDRDKTPLTQEDGRPYSGCYVNAAIEIWAQKNKWGNGIRATLKSVQFYKDGDAFSGGTPGSPDDFEDLSAEEGSELA